MLVLLAAGCSAGGTGDGEDDDAAADGLATAADDGGDDDATGGDDEGGVEPPAGDDEHADDADDADDTAGDDAAPAVDPADVGADELGRVPVLMYHRLLEGGGGDYDLTADQFRDELHWLFANGYSPIRTVDLVRGEIDVAAGRSPVVLTFDDSTREQAWLDDGEIAAESSMGILIDVAAEYDDVEPLASLYVITSSLFGGGGDGPAIVAELHDLGMEIGNHTHNHVPFHLLSDDEVVEEIARAESEIRGIVPDAEVATLSLPLGRNPENRDLLYGGEGMGFELDGVLLVGAEPSPSPFSPAFSPMAIPRIRSSPAWDGGEPDWGSRFWLEQLESPEGHRRYVSDGDPETISFPAEHEDDLAEEFTDRANPY